MCYIMLIIYSYVNYGIRLVSLEPLLKNTRQLLRIQHPTCPFQSYRIIAICESTSPYILYAYFQIIAPSLFLMVTLLYSLKVLFVRYFVTFSLGDHWMGLRLFSSLIGISLLNFNCTYLLSFSMQLVLVSSQPYFLFISNLF